MNQETKEFTTSYLEATRAETKRILEQTHGTQIPATEEAPKRNHERGNSPGGLFYDDYGIGFTGGDYSL